MILEMAYVIRMDMRPGRQADTNAMHLECTTKILALPLIGCAVGLHGEKNQFQGLRQYQKAIHAS